MNEVVAKVVIDGGFTSVAERRAQVNRHVPTCSSMDVRAHLIQGGQSRRRAKKSELFFFKF